MSKDSELESARQHFATLDNFWGRPGTQISLIIYYIRSQENTKPYC